MTKDAKVRSVGHLLSNSLDPGKRRGDLRRRVSDERIEMLNKPRYIENFEVLKEEHCDGVPIIVFQYSRQGPEFKFCPKCKLLIEEPIER